MTASISREVCETAVKNFIKSTDFILKDFKLTPLSDDIVGYMGQHFKLTANVTIGGKDQEIHLFAKLTPSSEDHRAFVIGENFFRKEATMYNTLVPKLESYLPPGESFPVPKCYLARATEKSVTLPSPGCDNENLIILEDLKARECTTVEKIPVLDIDHCKLVMETIAKFHATSILLERSFKISHPDSDPAEGLYSALKENVLVNKKGYFGYKFGFSSAESLVTVACKLWPERFEGREQEILAALNEGWNKLFEMIKPSKHYPNVLCHGDLWSMNMMFAYGKDKITGRKIPVDNVLVDLQAVRYAPPVTDILLFLHVSTMRAFREKNVRELLSVYHNTLAKYVTRDYLEKVFLPFETLVEMYHKYQFFGRLISTAYLPCTLWENDYVSENNSSEQPDLSAILTSNKGDSVLRSCQLRPKYRERIMESYQECLEELGLWK